MSSATLGGKKLRTIFRCDSKSNLASHFASVNVFRTLHSRSTALRGNFWRRATNSSYVAALRRTSLAMRYVSKIGGTPEILPWWKGCCKELSDR